MKKFFILCLASVLIAFSAAAYAASGDIGLGLSTEPTGGFGSGFNLSAGVNVSPADLQIKGLPKELDFRADVSYSRWKYSWAMLGFTGFDLKYSRIPIFLGGRFYVPLNVPNLKFYAEAGMEISIDTVDYPLYFWNAGNLKWSYQSTSRSSVEIGLTPGAGFQYDINKQIYVGANARFHFISDSYFTLGINVGTKF